jgi:hypothetical protein
MSPPYSTKRFGKLDFESLSLSLKKIQRFEGQLNVIRFGEGQLLSKKSLGYDVLQELNLCRRDNRFGFFGFFFWYPIEP